MPNTTTTTPAEASTERVVTTAKAAASALGIDRGTLYEWMGKGCPRQDGRFDLDEIRAWRDKHLRPVLKEANRWSAARRERPSVNEIVARFGQDLVGKDSAISQLLARWPRWKREFLIVDMLQYLAGLVEEVEPIDRDELFATLGLSDAGGKYHATYEKLGLSVEE